MSWLNTNTVQGRFDLIARVQYLKYSNYYRNTETPAPPATVNYPPTSRGRRPSRPSTARTRRSTGRGSPTRRGRADRSARARPRRARPPTAAAAAPAPLRAAGPDARRPRRTGDVTMRCIECEEIELARVRDERPGQTLPIPYAALDGFPAGRTPSRPDPPPAAAVGRRRLRVGLRRQGARLGGGLGLGRRGGRRAARASALVLLYLAGGNDGLNVDPAQRRGRLRGLRRGAPDDPSRRRADATGGPRRLARRCPGPGGAALAFANVDGLEGRRRRQLGRASTRGDGDSASTRCSATAPAAPAPTSRSCPRSTPSSTTSATSTTRDIWFAARNDLNIKTGWLGRWIDRNGTDDQPAAGDLDRHGAVEGDPHGGQARCARSRRCR